MREKISVIIPIYNVEPYLRKCLDSIINQTYRNLEIILVDDGSPDNCGMICDEYAAVDERIVVIHKSNGGLCAARNDGIRCATGDWISFVDSDDWCDLTYYEMFMCMDNIETADVLWAGGGFWEKEGKNEIKRTVINKFTDTYINKLSEGRREKLQARVLAKINIEDFDNSCAGGYCWDKIYRADFLKTNGLQFNTEQKALEDELFNFIVIGKAGKIIGSPFIGYHYRWNPLSITKMISLKHVDNTLIFADKLYESYKIRDSKIINRGISINILGEVSKCLKCCFSPKVYPVSEEEVQNVILKMKTNECVKDAIHFHSCLNYPPKYLMLKLTLRLPWIWPLRLLYFVNESYKRVKKHDKRKVSTSELHI